MTAEVKLVGVIPEKAVEKEVNHRFGQLCFTIRQTYKDLNITVPNDRLQRIEKWFYFLETMVSDPEI